MMGGEVDASSKGLFGTCETETGKYLLVVDPHFVTETHTEDPRILLEEGWVSWVSLNDFSSSGFYNLCLPQVSC